MIKYRVLLSTGEVYLETTNLIQLEGAMQKLEASNIQYKVES